MTSPTVIRCLPLGAVLLHLFEEFVWPGGFAEWYRWYRPERAASVTTGFLVRINALFVAMALIPGVLGFRPYGVAFWLVVASIAAANGLFHLWAVVRTRRYSPGVITGCIIYLPLAVFGFVYFWRAGLASISLLVQAALIGPAYNIYAAWNHRRRARSLASAHKD
ncbi:MAG: HXXEE domain-containing protein [Gemmatimonadota bacterium]|nr:HXXEE domain-containing protein [Gemmatimonadota bacterium]